MEVAVMRKESSQERAAWTALVEGTEALAASKYRNQPTNGYSSKREAKHAAELQMLAAAGKIKDLREQVKHVLVEGNGKIRPICYVSDFEYFDLENKLHICDSKGYSKNAVWRLKRKLMKLLLGLEIELL